MLIIEITPLCYDTKVRSGISKSGRPYSITEQQGYAFTGGEYPRRISFILPDGTPPYPPGKYILDGSSFSVGRYDTLNISAFVLVPVPPFQDGFNDGSSSQKKGGKTDAVC